FTSDEQTDGVDSSRRATRRWTGGARRDAETRARRAASKKRCGPRGPHRTPSLVADTDDDAVPATQVLEREGEVRKARVTVRIVVRTARDGCGLAHRCRRHIDHRSRRRTVDRLLHADRRPELEAHDEARRRAHDLEDLHVTMAAMAVLIAVVVA